jgi:hypothetical protein
VASRPAVSPPCRALVPMRPRREGLALEDAPTSASASPSGSGRCGSLRRVRRIKAGELGQTSGWSRYQPKRRRRPRDSKEIRGRASRATAPPEPSRLPVGRSWSRSRLGEAALPRTRALVNPKVGARLAARAALPEDLAGPVVVEVGRSRKSRRRLSRNAANRRRLRVVRLAAGSPGGEGVESDARAASRCPPGYSVSASATTGFTTGRWSLPISKVRPWRLSWGSAGAAVQPAKGGRGRVGCGDAWM